MKLRVLFVLLGIALLDGCATITGDRSQEIAIATQDDNGNAIPGVNCRIINDKGSWNVLAPGTVQISRSAKDVNVRCDKEGLPAGTAILLSRVNSGMLGNMLLTCGIGMPIDHFTGAGYDYPSPVTVTMGKEVRFEKYGGAGKEGSSLQPGATGK